MCTFSYFMIAAFLFIIGGLFQMLAEYEERERRYRSDDEANNTIDKKN